MNSDKAYNLIFQTGVSNLKLELAISQDGHYSLCYASYVLRGRFELGELAMSESGYYSLYYAISILRSRFKLGEELMCDYSHYYYDAYDYDYLVKVMGYDHE